MKVSSTVCHVTVETMIFNELYTGYSLRHIYATLCHVLVTIHVMLLWETQYLIIC